MVTNIKKELQALELIVASTFVYEADKSIIHLGINFEIEDAWSIVFLSAQTGSLTKYLTKQKKTRINFVDYQEAERWIISNQDQTVEKEENTLIQLGAVIELVETYFNQGSGKSNFASLDHLEQAYQHSLKTNQFRISDIIYQTIKPIVEREESTRINDQLTSIDLIFGAYLESTPEKKQTRVLFQIERDYTRLNEVYQQIDQSSYFSEQEKQIFGNMCTEIKKSNFNFNTFINSRTRKSGTDDFKKSLASLNSYKRQISRVFPAIKSDTSFSYSSLNPKLREIIEQDIHIIVREPTIHFSRKLIREINKIYSL